MNANRLARYRQQLEALRLRLRADATSVAEQALGPSGGQGDGALSNAPFHLGDYGAEEFLHDMSAALAENEEYLVRETQDALRRLEEGRFGRCQHCGATIAAERLDAMPYVRFCITCAETHNPGVDVNLNHGRPRGPADTLAPEGGMSEDWRLVASPLAETNGRYERVADRHAAGEPAGGGPFGGLAGGNSGHGDPSVADLQDSVGGPDFDRADARDNPPEAPRSGPTGGAVGGTPARKRSR